MMDSGKKFFPNEASQTDYFLLSGFMKDYDISQRALDSYKDEPEPEDNVEQELDEYDAMDEMDEETYKAIM